MLLFFFVFFSLLVYHSQGRVNLCGQQGGCTVGREEFLQALLILYKECTSPALMKIPNVANFVNKCEYSVLQHCDCVPDLFVMSCNVSVYVCNDDLYLCSIFYLMSHKVL